ncbi:MAG: hypothetical protein ACYTFQ_22585 [Planctomycetota bacterium]|jgi:hypothetical protein
MNKSKPWHWVLGVPASLIALWLLLQIPIEIGAESVYRERKPEMIETLDQKIKEHTLVIEPRLQAIEIEQKDSKKRDEDMMLIQREILEEVKK